MSNVVAKQAMPVREFGNVTREVFEREIKPLGEPAIMRGLVSDWPWVSHQDNPERLLSAVRAVSEDKPVQAFRVDAAQDGRYFYSDDVKGFNFTREAITLGQLCDALESDSTDHIYAGGVNIPQHAPRFLNSHEIELLPEGTEKLVSLWLGNRGRVPAHWDLPNNIAALVYGRREFTLFPNHQIGNLYVGPIDFTLAGQPCSLVDFHNPDFDRFPKFKDAMQHAQIAKLEPGDAIYVPSLWFHHVENPGQLGMLVNFWWREGPDYMFTPSFTLMHALLTLRDMPLEERARWQQIFDHYIFSANDETLAHIPDDARGVLSDMSSERVRALREFLGKQLLGR